MIRRTFSRLALISIGFLLCHDSGAVAELVRWQLDGLVIDSFGEGDVIGGVQRGDALTGTLTYDAGIPPEEQDEFGAFYPHAPKFHGLSLSIQDGAGETIVSFTPATFDDEPSFSVDMYRETIDGEENTSIFFSQAATTSDGFEALIGLAFFSALPVEFALPTTPTLDDWPIQSVLILPFSEDEDFDSFTFLEGQIFEATRIEAPIDFDGDGLLTAGDVDVLCSAVPVGSKSLALDLTDDGEVDDLDFAVLLAHAGSLSGDANLDGRVDFADFTVVSANFGETPAHWSDGDFSCNGTVDFADFLILSGNFGKASMVGEHLATVPEPCGLMLLALASLGFVFRFNLAP